MIESRALADKAIENNIDERCARKIFPLIYASQCKNSVFSQGVKIE